MKNRVLGSGMFRWMRFALPLAAAFVLTYWVLYGTALYSRLAGRSPEQYVKESIARLRTLDPTAARELERLKEERGVRALAVALRASEAQGDSHDSALRHAAATAHSGMANYNTRLSELADKADLIGSGNDLEDFLSAHAATCQLLASDQSGTALNFYLEQLEKAYEQPQVWRSVIRDPVALLVWPALASEPELWSFYTKNQDWLGKVLPEVANILSASKDPSQSGRHTTEEVLVDAVRAARDFDPLPRQAVDELQLGAPAFSLFLKHGKVIDLCTKGFNLPLGEVLDVVFVNPDFESFTPEYLQRIDRRASRLIPSPTATARSDLDLAAFLAYVHDNKPKVWTQARKHPLVLRLNRDAPQHVEQLMEQFGADGVTEFLYSSYEQEITQATECLARFGELGWYILGRYADDPRVHSALSNQAIGFRVVPFLVRSGDQAFDKLAEDKRWLDEYFNADGTPKNDDNAWLAAIPIVGGPAVVAKKKLQGRPLEWKELGWAAVDVADGVLLVMSFGASAEEEAAVESIKTAAKTEAKSAVRKAARANALRAAEGARAAARVEEGLTALQKLARGAGRTAELGKTVIVGGVRILLVPAEKIWNGVHQLERAWSALPPATRRWVYRGALAVGLLTTLHERTIPNLPALAGKVGEELGNAIHQTVKSSAELLAGVARGTLGLSSEDQVKARLAFWGVTAILAFILIRSAWRATRQTSVRMAA